MKYILRYANTFLQQTYMQSGQQYLYSKVNKLYTMEYVLIILHKHVIEFDIYITYISMIFSQFHTRYEICVLFYFCEAF